MKTKVTHTPGPWRVINDDAGTEIVGAMGSSIARWDFALMDEADANARLIAAGPDLLEAAKLATATVEAAGGQHVFKEMYAALQVAIAKAEGRD
jgi:hypothetical protein